MTQAETDRIFDLIKKYPKEVDEFNALGWRIIEWKVAYYLPDYVHPERLQDYVISDEEYDRHERRYLDLCRLLERRNTLVHKGYPGYEDIDSTYAMFEVEQDRPSVQLVLSKLCTPKGTQF